MQSEPLFWKDLDVVGPNVEKRETLLQLAKMTYNSYIQPSDKDWYEIGVGWDTVRASFTT
jgi:lipase ATG15